MSKVSKIDQIHLRAVMLMSKTSKMYITRDQSNVEGVEGSNTPKGCNAMYVEDIEDVHS